MKHFTKIFFVLLLTLCFAGTAAFTGTGTASAQESGSEPSDGFIFIPGGMKHLPLSILELHRPILHFSISMSSQYALKRTEEGAAQLDQYLKKES